MTIHFAYIPLFTLLSITTANISRAVTKYAIHISHWQAYTSSWHAIAKSNSFNDVPDSTFIKKVSEANLAEIELAQLALKKASSEKVKEFAHTMIEHHTMAQTGLASIVINHPTWAGNRVGDMSDDANTQTSIGSENNDADKTATLGGTGGTVGNATAEGMTNGRYNSNLPSKGSSMKDSDQMTESQPTDSLQETNEVDTVTNRPTNSSTTIRTPDKNATTSYELPTQPSPEHRALISRLVTLSGMQFEKQYMLAMVEEHATIVDFFEKKAMDSNSTDEQVINYAKKKLPLLKKHYTMAKEISATY